MKQRLPRRKGPRLPLSTALWLIGSCAMLAAACGSPTPPAPSKSVDAAAPAASVAAPGRPQGWDELVDAARREGTVTVYGPAGRNYRAVIEEAFEKAYPGIKVQATYADGNEHVARVVAERTAGKHIADVMIHGATNLVVQLKDAGALAPLKPALVLPDVLDESLWLGKRLWWADAAEPYTNLVFMGTIEPPVSYNTQLVDPGQFTSYWQLLDPKWKGKLVASDVRSPGPGGGATRFMYKHPELGAPFLQRLFGETEITLSSDQRQMVDWLAQGRFSVGVFVSTTQISNAAPLGLPIALVPGEQFKEGAPLSSASGSLGLIDRAPHPNAAKLFINWLLSREGQTAWQTLTYEPSLRVDIPKVGLFEALTPKPGVDYVFVSNEEYSRLTGAVLRDLINSALERKAS